ncbi:MAG: hypothetical protein VX474_04060 [Pseudomonadota bacterium]|nr:hypothetical protein [Pseudomonadota bacterium]MEC8524194.1 hypothetical protein [Pseudomonadota bacterium]MEE2749127.1 hypothetical protein [Pseudomonadota bacterium]
MRDMLVSGCVCFCCEFAEKAPQRPDGCGIQAAKTVTTSIVKIAP